MLFGNKKIKKLALAASSHASRVLLKHFHGNNIQKYQFSTGSREHYLHMFSFHILSSDHKSINSIGPPIEPWKTPAGCSLQNINFKIDVNRPGSRGKVK